MHLAFKRIRVVLYHHIADDDTALTSQLDLATPPALFEDHLKFYSKNYDIISTDDFLDGPLPKKPLLITFDDFYRSVLDVAGPLLRQYNAPSLFFVNPRTADEDWLPMDMVISYAIAQMGFEETVRCFGENPAAIRTLYDLISGVLPRTPLDRHPALKERLLSKLSTTEGNLRRSENLLLNAGDLPTLADYGIAIGNHSSCHCFFRAVQAHEMNREIVESRAALERLSGQTIRTFSLPYGKEADATPEMLRTARMNGHEAIFLTQNKSNMMRLAPDIYYRTSLYKESVAKLPFLLEAQPVLRSFRHAVAGQKPDRLIPAPRAEAAPADILPGLGR